MVALGDGVWLAALVAVVLAASDNALVLEILPGSSGVATVAAVAAGEGAAGHEVLGRDVGLLGTAGGNADAVSQALDAAKGPAATAGTLVADLLCGGAHVAPLVTGVERGGQVLRDLNVDDIQLNRGALKVGTHLAADVLEGNVHKAVVDASLPANVLGVDVIGKLLQAKHIMGKAHRRGRSVGNSQAGHKGEHKLHSHRGLAGSGGAEREKERSKKVGESEQRE